MSKRFGLILALLGLFLSYLLLTAGHETDSKNSLTTDRIQGQTLLTPEDIEADEIIPGDLGSKTSQSSAQNSTQAKTVNLPNFANPEYRPDFVRGSFPDEADQKLNNEEPSSSEDQKPDTGNQEKLKDEVSAPSITAEDDTLFTAEELALLQQPQETSSRRQRNDLAGPPPRKRASTNSNTQASKPDKAEVPEPDSQKESLPRVTGQIRGYQLLNLMQPQARAMVEQSIQILLNAQIQDIYLGVLTDGTFGWDPNYLTDVINRLSTDERRLTLALYLTNGSTMRNYESTDIEAGFNTMEPAEFRSRIRFDPATRSKYVELVQRVRPIFVFNSSLHPENRNIAVPMLEDNLDYDSYLAMRELTKAILGNGVQYLRNPCLDCYDGNDIESGSDPREFHGLKDYSLLEPGDGLTLDGTGFFHSFESPAPYELSVSEVTALMDATRQKRLYYFALWRFDRQGISPGQPLLHPDKRTFVVPSEAHKKAEIEILRHGLSIVEGFPADQNQESLE